MGTAVAVEKVPELMLVSAVEDIYKQTRVPDAVLDRHFRRLAADDGSLGKSSARKFFCVLQVNS